MRFSTEEIQAAEAALLHRCQVPAGNATIYAVVALDAVAKMWAGLFPEVTPTTATTEGGVQDRVRLKAAKLGWELWRNNNGVAVDERGVPVRFGLANDSAKLNAKIKSADLIGIRPIKITGDMIGSIVGQFLSLEVKHPNWKYSNTEREQAQARWAAIVRAAGGHAQFITSEEQL